ncbi:MAG: hypothetical protein ABJO27_14160 [Pseudoruegeria sp.]
MDIVNSEIMDNLAVMTTVRTIADKLGRKYLAAITDSGLTSVGNWVTYDSIPAKHWVIVSDACREKRILCPVELFSFTEFPKEFRIQSSEAAE